MEISAQIQAFSYVTKTKNCLTLKDFIILSSMQDWHNKQIRQCDWFMSEMFFFFLGLQEIDGDDVEMRLHLK